MIKVKQRLDIIYPTKVVKTCGEVRNEGALLDEKPLALTPSFNENINALLKKDGDLSPFVILDFGKEIQGGIRLAFSSVFPNYLKMRFVFGESVSECLHEIGEKGAHNPHGTKYVTVEVANLSVREFTRQGFRFVKIELLDQGEVWIKKVEGLLITEDIEKAGYIKTDDALLNDILDTATYTAFLCAQEGVIYDGIKRDRLVWAGDLNSEILTLTYLYGDFPNVKNSLKLLKDEASPRKFMNGIPSYSVWWVLNLVDYYTLSKDEDFVLESLDYLNGVLLDLDSCVLEDKIDFSRANKAFDMEYFLDWPSYKAPDAVTGVKMLILYTLQRLKGANLKGVDYSLVDGIISRINGREDEKSSLKQVVALKALAGKSDEFSKSLLEKDGAKGFSSFMSYFILKALDKLKSPDTLNILKEYYGGMLSRGATTFWEDFDVTWLENSGRIDEETPEGVPDIHGDFGRFCYEGLKHSLCHGWSSGVVGFFVENVLGLEIVEAGYKTVRVKPNLYSLNEIEAVIPTPFGNIKIKIKRGEKPIVAAPYHIKIID